MGHSFVQGIIKLQNMCKHMYREDHDGTGAAHLSFPNCVV